MFGRYDARILTILMILTLLALLAMTLWAPAEEAPKPAGQCVDISVPKAGVESTGGRWIELTHDQFRFMQGVYVLDPITAAGLPVGNRGVLAQTPGDEGGLIFFLDGNRACSPMPVQKEILEFMRELDEPQHESGGL